MLCSRFYFSFFHFYDIFVFNNKILYNICLDRHLLYVTLLFGFHTTTVKKSKSSSLDMLFLLSYRKIHSFSFLLPRLWHFLFCFFMLMLFFDPSRKIFMRFPSVFIAFLSLFFYVCDRKWSEIQYIFDSKGLILVEFCYAIYFYDMWPLSLWFEFWNWRFFKVSYFEKKTTMSTKLLFLMCHLL